jgi:hypothetical protein
MVGNRAWFITSQNMDFVPQPPLVFTHNMRIRVDFKYGKDDPLQWPQPYLSSNCHLGAIPLRPGPDDPMSIMWWHPEPDDFVPSTAATISGLGLIDNNHFAHLHNMVSWLCGRAEAFMSRETSGKNEVILSLVTVVTQGVKRLETLPMSCRQVFMNGSYVQRCLLELIAALDYLETFHPRMQGLCPVANMVGLRIGMFTHDPMVVQDFMRAGLPVWFICPYDALHTARIESVKEVWLPEDYLRLDDASPQFKPFFVRQADHPKCFFGFHSYLQAFFSYPNSFDVMDKASSDPLSASSSAQSSTTLVNQTTKMKPSHNQPCMYLLYLPCSITNTVIE